MAFDWTNALPGVSLGGLGGIAGGLGLFGGGKPKKLPTMSKEQQSFFSNFINRLKGMEGADQGSIDYLMQLMDPNSEAVNQFTAPYMREFNEKTVPGLAERFAGMGAMGGGLSSSGFGQSLGAAGAGLQEKLAALKSGLGTQAANQLMSTYGQRAQAAFGEPTFQYQQNQPGFGENVMAGLMQMLPYLMMG